MPTILVAMDLVRITQSLLMAAFDLVITVYVFGTASELDKH